MRSCQLILVFVLAVSCGSKSDDTVGAPEASNALAVQSNRSEPHEHGDGNAKQKEEQRGSSDDRKQEEQVRKHRVRELTREPLGNLLRIYVDCSPRLNWLEEPWSVGKRLTQWTTRLGELGVVRGVRFNRSTNGGVEEVASRSDVSLRSPVRALCDERFDSDGGMLAGKLLKMAEKAASHEDSSTVLAWIVDGNALREASNRAILGQGLTLADAVWVGTLQDRLKGRLELVPDGNGTEWSVGQQARLDSSCEGAGMSQEVLADMGTGEPFVIYEGGMSWFVVVAAYGLDKVKERTRILEMIDEASNEILFAGSNMIRVFPIGGLDVKAELREPGKQHMEETHLMLDVAEKAVVCENARAGGTVPFSFPVVGFSEQLGGRENARGFVGGEKEGFGEEFDFRLPESVPVAKIEVSEEAVKLGSKGVAYLESSVTLDESGAVSVSCDGLQSWMCSNPDSYVTTVSFSVTPVTAAPTEWSLPDWVTQRSTTDWNSAPCSVPFLREFMDGWVPEVLDAVVLQSDEKTTLKLELERPECPDK